MKGGIYVFFDGTFDARELETYLSSAYRKFRTGTKFAQLTGNEKAAVNQAAGRDARADEILRGK